MIRTVVVTSDRETGWQPPHLAKVEHASADEVQPLVDGLSQLAVRRAAEVELIESTLEQAS